MAKYDLGSGYPTVPLPLYLQQAIASLDGAQRRAMQPDWTHEEQRSVDRALSTAVRDLLGIPRNQDQVDVAVTFSGAVALNRAIQACLEWTRETNKENLRLITTSPSIDIIPNMLDEHYNISVHFCDSDPHSINPRIETILEAIETKISRTEAIALLLCSPENPTGYFYPLEQLETIARRCAELGVILIFDHAFMFSGVQDCVIPSIWSVAPPHLEWIAIWDTGKTLGLGGEKLGFIISSKTISPHVNRLLLTIQFDVSRRQKVLFSNLVDLLHSSSYLHHLAIICRRNLELLSDSLRASPVTVMTPASGTLVLLKLPRLAGINDVMVSQELLEMGVGVVPGSVFFHGPAPRRDDLVRIALARDETQFKLAVDVIAEYIRRRFTNQRMEIL